MLDHYRELPKSYELPVKDLSQKLALITEHRMQTFSLIKTVNIRFQNDNVEIKILALIRNNQCSLFPGIKKKKRFAST